MPGLDIRPGTSLQLQTPAQRPEAWLSQETKLAPSTAVQDSSSAGLQADTASRLTTRPGRSLAHSYTSASATSPTACTVRALLPVPVVGQPLSISAFSQTYPLAVTAAPLQTGDQRASVLRHMHNDTMSDNRDQGTAAGQPRGTLFQHTDTESSWTIADDYLDCARTPAPLPQAAVPLMNKKLAKLRARSGCGGYYMDFATNDPRGIFCLHSVPCCSGPFDSAGECTSSSNGGFCSCKLSMAPLIRGVK